MSLYLPSMFSNSPARDVGLELFLKPQRLDHGVILARRLDSVFSRDCDSVFHFGTSDLAVAIGAVFNSSISLSLARL